MEGLAGNLPGHNQIALGHEDPTYQSSLGRATWSGRSVDPKLDLPIIPCILPTRHQGCAHVVGSLLPLRGYSTI